MYPNFIIIKCLILCAIQYEKISLFLAQNDIYSMILKEKGMRREEEIISGVGSFLLISEIRAGLQKSS